MTGRALQYVLSCCFKHYLTFNIKADELQTDGTVPCSSRQLYIACKAVFVKDPKIFGISCVVFLAVMLHLISKSGVSSLAFRPRLQRRSMAQYSYVGDGIDCHPKHQTAWDSLVKKFQGPAKPGTLILVRHGESEWNHRRLFTGWVDVDLSDRGIREIEHASRLLLERGYTVDVTYTSVLKRAVRSSWIMLNEINQIYRPVKKSWRLNERM